jgi:hypothetical protein
MTNLRREIQAYLKNQELLRGKAVKLATALKSFGDTEAPKLGGFLYCLSEAMSAKDKAHEEAMQQMALSCIEPLKYYHVLVYVGLIRRSLARICKRK